MSLLRNFLKTKNAYAPNWDESISIRVTTRFPAHINHAWQALKILLTMNFIGRFYHQETASNLQLPVEIHDKDSFKTLSAGGVFSLSNRDSLCYCDTGSSPHQPIIAFLFNYITLYKIKPPLSTNYSKLRKLTRVILFFRNYNSLHFQKYSSLFFSFLGL